MFRSAGFADVGQSLSEYAAGGRFKPYTALAADDKLSPKVRKLKREIAKKASEQAA